MAKRVAASSIKWAMLSDTTPAESKDLFFSFKAKTDKYLRLVQSYPAELPKIDWSFYSSKIAAPGVVDSLKKGYESMKIPYPTDQGFLDQINSEEARKLKQLKENNKELEEKVKALGEKLKNLESVKPYSQMSLEEFYLTRPDLAINPDKPKLWPQNLPDKL